MVALDQILFLRWAEGKEGRKEGRGREERKGKGGKEGGGEEIRDAKLPHAQGNVTAWCSESENRTPPGCK